MLGRATWTGGALYAAAAAGELVASERLLSHDAAKLLTKPLHTQLAALTGDVSSLTGDASSLTGDASSTADVPAAAAAATGGGPATSDAAANAAAAAAAAALRAPLVRARGPRTHASCPRMHPVHVHRLMCTCMYRRWGSGPPTV